MTEAVDLARDARLALAAVRERERLNRMFRHK
jgi:hypothetical protein